MTAIKRPGRATPFPTPNPRDRTLERVAARRISDDRLFDGNGMALVAVSGGADSVALLHLLAKPSAEGARAGATNRTPTAAWPKIAAAHVNHGIRGAAANEDARFVRELAEAWAVPYFEAVLPPGALRPVGRSDGGPAASRALAPEAEARRLRYAALGDLARQAGADRIALAHTADDQAETVLFRMARGAGLKGLAGMTSKRRLGELTIVRPLLDVTREQVLEYIERHDLRYREDASNASLDAARNFIRHEIVPRLRERLNPAVRDALLREAALFRDADEYLECEARRLLLEATVSAEAGKIVLDAARIGLYPKLLRFYIFRSALHDLDGVHRELSATHVDALLSLAAQSRGRSVDLPMGIQARRERGRVVLAVRNREPEREKARPRLETLGVPADSRKGTTSE